MEKIFVAAAIAVLLVYVYIKARKGIVAALDAKIDAIRTELDDARKLHEDARALMADYEKKRSNAAADSVVMVQHAEDAAERMVSDAKKELEEQLERRMATVKERIKQAEVQAIQDVRAAAVDVATQAAEQLIRDNLSADQKQQLAQASLKEAAQKLH